MKNLFRVVISACLVFLISGQLLAEAPVVDDSENYALLEQQATHRSSVVAESSGYDDSEPALARDTSDTGSDNTNVNLINKIQGLQQEIQELRGQLEVQAHDINILKEQQLAFYHDLDSRISTSPAIKAAKNQSTPSRVLQIDEKPAPMRHVAAETPKMASVPSEKPISQTQASSPAAIVTTTSNNPADEQISYLKAYELVKNKQYDEALVAMQSFTQKHPTGGYTANAEYWLGELYLVKQNYADAINHFSIVLQQFPSSSKYSASLLKLGYALADAGRMTEAKQRLHEVMNKYPDTPTANLARLKLETLGG